MTQPEHQDDNAGMLDQFSDLTRALADSVRSGEVPAFAADSLTNLAQSIAPATTSQRLVIDITGLDSRALRLVCAFNHRLAVDKAHDPLGALASAIVAEIDEALACRERDVQLFDDTHGL